MALFVLLLERLNNAMQIEDKNKQILIHIIGISVVLIVGMIAIEKVLLGDMLDSSMLSIVGLGE